MKEFVLSFYCMSFKGPNQVSRLSGRHLCSQQYLIICNKNTSTDFPPAPFRNYHKSDTEGDMDNKPSHATEGCNTGLGLVYLLPGTARVQCKQHAHNLCDVKDMDLSYNSLHG